jgi:hypothetical protein
MDNIERLQRKKQQQKARRKEKKAAKEEAAKMADNEVSEGVRRMRMLHPALNGWYGYQSLTIDSQYGPVTSLTDEDWEQLGRDMNGSNYLEILWLICGTLNDQKMLYLFRGLTGSNTIRDIILQSNDFGVEGVRSMVPFLQNASNLKKLDVGNNDIGSEGFALMWRALCDRPITHLKFSSCRIKSIAIDGDCIPLNLRELRLTNNEINDGCRELAKLLQGRDSKLEKLDLKNNRIDDEGVAILVNALENNTSLRELHLEDNRGITTEGRKLLLKLVNDVSSIKATLKSNHTLWKVDVSCFGSNGEEIQNQISAATYTNESYGPDIERIAKAKVIFTQLHSAKRERFCRLQGVERANDAVYNEIDPLHLPEVLSMVGRAHGLSQFHEAIKSSIAALVSTVDKEIFIQQKRDYYAAKVAELDAELAAIRRAKGGPQPQNKRQRI